MFDRKLRIIRVEDSLQHDRAVPVLSEELEIIPAVRVPGEGLADEGLRREQRVVLGRVSIVRLGKFPPENRIAQPILESLPVDEGQEGAVQIQRPPRQAERVEGHDEDVTPARSSPAEKRCRDLLVLGPVELEPPWRTCVRRSCHFLDRGGACCAQCEGHTEVGTGRSDTQLTILVVSGLDPDWGHHNRARWQ